MYLGPPPPNPLSALRVAGGSPKTSSALWVRAYAAGFRNKARNTLTNTQAHTNTYSHTSLKALDGCDRREWLEVAASFLFTPALR